MFTVCCCAAILCYCTMVVDDENKQLNTQFVARFSLFLSQNLSSHGLVYLTLTFNIYCYVVVQAICTAAEITIFVHYSFENLPMCHELDVHNC